MASHAVGLRGVIFSDSYGDQERRNGAHAGGRSSLQDGLVVSAATTGKPMQRGQSRQVWLSLAARQLHPVTPLESRLIDVWHGGPPHLSVGRFNVTTLSEAALMR